jgi:tellurite resistance protein TehA-like permease
MSRHLQLLLDLFVLSYQLPLQIKMHRPDTRLITMAFAGSALISLVANLSLAQPQLPRASTILVATFCCLFGTALVFVLDRLVLYPRFRSKIRQRFPAMLVSRMYLSCLEPYVNTDLGP